MLLLGCLTASLAAAVQVNDGNGHDRPGAAVSLADEATDHGPAAPASSGPIAPLALERIMRPTEDIGEANPFAAKSWVKAPPPAPPVAAAAPAPPQAPPLPFTYHGMLEQPGGQWIVQLARGSDFLLAGKGDTIDGVYRVEGIENNQLVFRYLPLALRQTLPVPMEAP